MVFNNIIKVNRSNQCLSALITTILASSFIHSTNASLSATTAQTIQGTEPYFAFDNQEIGSLSDLLWFSYPASGSTVKISIDNSQQANSANVITLPVGMKENQLKALIPIDNTSRSLQDLVRDENSLLTIADGDGDAIIANNRIATGGIKATLFKNNVAVDSLTNSELNGCYTYKLQIGFDASSVSGANFVAQTRYGEPNSKNYPYSFTLSSGEISTVTYVLEPTVVKPYVCHAQPNLKYGEEVNNFPFGGGSGTTVNLAGPTKEWEVGRGFKLQSLTDASKNFPRYGFNGAYFLLTLRGTTAAAVISHSGGATIESDSGIKLLLSDVSTSDEQIVKVQLKGVRAYDMTSIGTLSPSTSTFRFKAHNDEVIYSFELSKWFIFAGNMLYREHETNTDKGNIYCETYGSGKYILPTRADFTDSKYANNSQYPSSAVVPPFVGNGYFIDNHYTRTISGGLYSQWGYMYQNEYYTDSGWNISGTWTREQAGSKLAYLLVDPMYGTVLVDIPAKTGFAITCVTPRN